MRAKHRSVLRAAGPVLTAALVAAAVTGCGSSSDGGTKNDAQGKSATSADAGKSDDGATGKGGGLPGGIKLPKTLPTQVKDVKSDDWKNWNNWAKQKVFSNPRIADLWTAQRMAHAKDASITQDKGIPKTAGNGKPGTDPMPSPVLAKSVARPYTAPGRSMLGKLFFDAPEGQMVCSATVIEDPKHPGKSNLVWTAGHCVHGGKGKGFYRNFAFVPSYNSGGTAKSQLEKPDAKIAPHGIWWATAGQTSMQWVQTGGETGGHGTQYDYSVLRVAPPKGSHAKSLEETVGGAVPVAFNAKNLKSIQARGYPAGPPYDGLQQKSCTQKPSHLSIDPKAPNDYRIGCTMTGGSSGGGWFATTGGKLSLVSNTSIGPGLLPTWLAGPYLGDVAKTMFSDFVARNPA